MPRRSYFLIPAVVFLVGTFFLYGQTRFSVAPYRYIDRLTYSSVHGHAQPILELHGLRMGRRFEVTSDDAPVNHTVQLLQSALLERFDQYLDELQYPRCSMNTTRYRSTCARRVPNRRKAVVTIAIDLHNSEEVLPSLSMALVDAVSHLLPHNRVYVSIFENNSDDKTKDLLSELSAALYFVGVDGLWVRSSRLKTDFNSEDRIVMMAEIRNEALSPLIPHAEEGTFVFINDVICCASDIMELIHQQRLQHADLVMGMDYTNDGNQPRLYDVWVTRGINGLPAYNFREPSGFTPYAPDDDWLKGAFATQDPEVHRRWIDGRPIPMYSGWNGAVAFDASLFTKDHVRFRSSRASSWAGGDVNGSMGAWGALVATPGYMESDCPGASECEYVARDIWHLRGGRARIALAPQARTVYTADDWELMDRTPPTRRDDEDDHRDLVDWANITIPENVTCMPGRREDGSHIWEWDSREQRDPRFHSRFDP